VLNCLNDAILLEIRSVLKAVADDPEARVLVMTGNGRAFCAGADLAMDDRLAGLSMGKYVEQKMEALFNPVMRDLFRLNKPIVAAVNGIAAGGGVGVALTADIVLAARSASFRLVFVPALGLVPDLGSSFFLPRAVGRARALGLCMLGEPLPAEKAAEWGLVWKCVDDEKLMDEAMELAARLARGPTLAFPALRRLVAAADHNTLEQHLDLERDVQRVLADSEDFLEGVAAFLQKRKPRFKGC
jgi:2-(1,2-epoxy-1,2-dihydrophenyl)acetyl-CoA isomerase